MGKKCNLKLTWHKSSGLSLKNLYGLEWAVPQGNIDNHAEEISHTSLTMHHTSLTMHQRPLCNPPTHPLKKFGQQFGQNLTTDAWVLG